MEFITNYFNLLDSQTTFIAFDLETTGLNNRIERIIEIGAVKYQDGRIVDKFATLINPGKPIPEGASKVNGIYDSDVANAPLVEYVLPQFRDYIKGSILMAHNANFDTGFINKSLSRMDYSPLDNKIIDTIAMAKVAFPSQRSYSQVNLANFLGINVKNAHRAEDDARVCLELFIACAKALDAQNSKA